MSPRTGAGMESEDENESNSTFMRNTELELMRLNQKYSELEKRVNDETTLLKN